MSDKPKFYDFVNVYDFTCELPGSKETIQFKPVSTGQIKKLLTYENETNFALQEMALDELIKSSVLTEGFSIDDIYIHDRFFLLIQIRKKSKGEVIEFPYTCRECGSQTLNRVDLNLLNVKEIDEDIDPSVELSRGIKVYLKHMKRKDLKEIKPAHFKKNMTNTQLAAEYQTLFHACAIDKIEVPDGIDDNLRLSDKVYLIDNIPTGEFDKIREKVNEMSFGVDLTYTIHCMKCKKKMEVEVPIHENFFL
jgi:hypothetical protein